MNGEKRQPYSPDNFQLGVDLEETSVFQLSFLETVFKSPALSAESVLERAIWRYEHLWLPLAAESQDSGELLPAPLDVEWVWHCHLLSPLAYEKDCLEIVGKLVDHKLWSSEERQQSLDKSKRIWESKYPEEAFDFRESDAWNEKQAAMDIVGSKITYNIRGAIFRQKDFYYEVSLPHFKDAKFLATALDRYKRFLYLRQQFPSVFLVPSYDIDLMWHTHQLHPKHYQTDTLKLLGRIFNHDDSVNDRSPGSKLSIADGETRNLWRDTFEENFTMYGAMYRGFSPAGKLADIPPDNLIAMATKKCRLTIKAIDVDGLASSEPRLRLEIAIVASEAAKARDPTVRPHAQICSLKEHGSSWRGENLVSTVFQTKDDVGLHFSVSEKFGNFCFTSKEDVGYAFDNIASEVESHFPDGMETTRALSLNSSDGVKLKYLLKTGPPKLGPLALTVTAGTYESCIMPEMIEQMWGPIPLARLPQGTDNTCEVASHR